MAKSNTESASHKDVEKALSSLGPLASVVGKSAATLWKIFVMEYVAQGVSELVTAILIMGGSVWLLGTHNLWLFVPAAISTWFLYLAIPNLVNPFYPAMEDVIKHVQHLSKK